MMPRIGDLIIAAFNISYGSKIPILTKRPTKKSCLVGLIMNVTPKALSYEIFFPGCGTSLYSKEEMKRALGCGWKVQQKKSKSK